VIYLIDVMVVWRGLVDR